MEPDALPLHPAAALRDGDVEAFTLTHEHLPFDGGGEVTQGTAWAARENSGNEAALAGELLMTERVHTAPQPLQLARLHALVDPVVAQAAGSELRCR